MPIRRCAAGLTLLELIIGIGILITLLALAVPTVYSALERRELASVADEIVGSLLMARAHAQAEGATVEIVLVVGEGERAPMRLIAREIDLHAPPFDDEDGPPPLMMRWADQIVAWPLRVSVADAESTAQNERGEFDDELDRFANPSRPETRRAEPTERDGQGPVLPSRGRSAAWTTNRATVNRERIAVFAADGSALIAPRLRLTDAAGRFVEIVINPWTGLPRLVDPDAEPSP